MSKAYYCPLNLKQTREATFHCEWIVSDAEYDAQWGTFLPLNCGQAAFDAVHRAIAQARRSVDIICWGFQPSMHFIRDGKQPPIGQLLEQKAAAGVEVRILGWDLEPTPALAAAALLQHAPPPLGTLGQVAAIGAAVGSITGINVTGVSESNLPGKDRVRVKSRPGKHTLDQYADDKRWFRTYAYRSSIATPLVFPLHQPWRPAQQRNLIFIGRGFSTKERLEILYAARYHALSPTAFTQQLASAAAPSHHQKMVLIDMGDPTLAYGFVMGHNMLDEYWDTPAHSVRVHPPDQGRNGTGPRQDISSRVSGPILQHLHHNFAQAWQQETGEDLLALRKAKDVHPRLPLRTDIDPKGKCMLQILRTQPQQRHPLSGKKGIKDIEKMYLQAVNNAVDYLYFENQYFRWPALADKINDVAAKLTGAGREAGRHGSLHVFAVTNASDEGMGDGTVNTYHMLDILGRAELIPNVARKREVLWREQQLKEARQAAAKLDKQVSRSAARKPQPDAGHAALLQQANAARDAAVKAEVELQASREAARQMQKAGQPQTITPQPRPGLKIHVCTLVAPDSPAGKPWLPVYIHSKLTLIDDVFTTLGSANLNTRSMQVDSELNIAHQHGALTKNLRLQLWSQHTWDRNKKVALGAQEDVAEAFKEWGELIERNKKAQDKGFSPISPLVEFYRDSPAVSNLD